MKLYLSLIAILVTGLTIAQETMNETLPYSTIPKAPDTYTPGTVVSRMIDGLGFRYYWATEGLTEENLAYKASEEGRTIAQTMDHIYGLSRTIVNSAKKQPTDFTIPLEELSTMEKRKRTLENFKTASELFKVTEDLAEHKIVFINKNGKSEFPFWNHLNGPIEDAVWHAGQIVMMRRAAGNPFNSKVSVFMGKVRD
ncbi:MAG: hypothetical protein KJN85_05600 [Maribacter sp.]|nr:hypothetical protein [Maribacter sp.]MBT8312823.1 hypothetical protein [Maribacter sp.]